MDDSANTSPWPPKAPSLIHNWLSLLGLIVAAGSFFAVLCLLAMDFFAQFSNPYMGILTYFVAPFFLITGLILVVVGIIMERRRLVQRGRVALTLFPIIDLNRPRHRKLLGSLGGFAVLFFLLTAIGSYRSYHFTESTQFCGQTCHAVMRPEFAAYQNSPHARVTCTECHIGSGATWFVRSKLSGSYQVYATLFDKYPRPIPTPVKNLRPAQETCEQCHWPQKFYGAIEKVGTHFKYDEKNSPWTVELLLKVGGGDPTHGPVGGIHWHMNVANKVEYIATDEARQKIAWIRFTDSKGNTTVYEAKENKLKPAQLASASVRRMDCIDCHNRPTHIFRSPDEAVDSAMALGRIDPALPSIKKNAVDALAADYQTTAEALQKITDLLTKKYASANPATVQRAIAELRRIYQANFFPEMKSRWKVYPNNIGHLEWSGCFRCHDGQHASADGKIISDNCNSCHTIIAQGAGMDLKTLSAQGFEFQHPSEELGDAWKGQKCSDCHNGGSM
jgi:nitrate/TMAO reductase-like tetraheme cytochrome c subunit